MYWSEESKKNNLWIIFLLRWLNLVLPKVFKVEGNLLYDYLLFYFYDC